MLSGLRAFESPLRLFQTLLMKSVFVFLTINTIQKGIGWVLRVPFNRKFVINN